MKKMIIRNVKIYTEENGFKPGFVVTDDKRIEVVCFKDSPDYERLIQMNFDLVADNCLDGKGAYLIPGMIDIHLHGCKGYDFCDGSLEAIEQIMAYQASIGVTTVVPATMTLPVEQLEKILTQLAVFHEKKACGEYEICADLAGINMEGPFISETKRGAQKADYIRKADVELFRRFMRAADGLIKYIGVAPEIEGAVDFIQEIREEVKVTVAHSNAGYTKAKVAFEAGALHVTHLYNGMKEYSHREPGVIGAVYDCKDVEAELICDGIHVHPAVIRATFDMLGKERIIFISDSIRAAGMQPGEYELGGQKVEVKSDRVTISGTETIAGSVINLPDAFRYAVKEVGIPLEEAVICVTKNPALSLGIYEERGSVSVGKRADLLLLNEELVIAGVIKNGHLL